MCVALWLATMKTFFYRGVLCFINICPSSLAHLFLCKAKNVMVQRWISWWCWFLILPTILCETRMGYKWYEMLLLFRPHRQWNYFMFITVLEQKAQYGYIKDYDGFLIVAFMFLLVFITLIRSFKSTSIEFYKTLLSTW